MKVLFVNNTAAPKLYGGYEIYMEKIARAFRREGVQTGILSSVGADAITWHNRYLSPLAPDQLPAREAADGEATRRTIERVRPDVISIWNLGGVAKSVFDTIATSGVPYTLHVGDLWPVQFFQRPDPRFENVHHISRFTERTCETAGLVPRRSMVSYWGTDLGSDAPIETGSGILFAGRICKQKGLLTLVRALARTERFALTVAGAVEDEDYLNEVKAVMADARLDGRVSFLGAIRPGAMPSVFAEHNLLVFPSEYDEAFGLSLIEAMAAGLTVIASAVGGVPEIIEDGVNGFLFEPGNVDDLADRLREAGGRHVAQAARRTVAERFSFERSLRDIMEFLKTAVRESSDAQSSI